MSSTHPIHQVIQQGYENLKGLSDQPRSDVQLLLANILGRTRSWLLAHPEAKVTNKEEEDFLDAIRRYKSGEPLPYILGWWEFFGRRFTINHSVLIPRPETEHIVEYAIDFLLTHPQRRFGLDIGTGSGCIAVTLTDEVKDLRMVASDISYPALQLARENAILFGVDTRLHFCQMDLTTATRARFDLICANLPYIPTTSLKNLKVAKNEPWIALDGGGDGFSFIRPLLNRIQHLLTPGGCALVEIEAGTGERVMDFAKGIILGAKLWLIQDLAGHNRVLGIEYNGL